MSKEVSGTKSPIQKDSGVIDLDEIQSTPKTSSASLYEASKLMNEIRVSLTELDLAKCPKVHGPFVTTMKKLFGANAFMHRSLFECRDKQLYNYCLKGVKDKHELHKKRIMGLRIINEIILMSSPNYITPAHVVNLVWSYMSCMHHFQLRLRTDSTGIVRQVRKNTIEQCMQTYSKLIRMFSPTLHRVVLSAILTFYRGARMWEFEFACTDLVLNLLSIHSNIDQAIGYIFYTSLEIAKENFTEARHMFQILYNVLKKLKWYSASQEIMNNFLDAYESSIQPKPTDAFDYVPLRKSLELCIRNAVDNFENHCLIQTVELCVLRLNNNEDLDEDILLEVGNIAAYAAGQFKVKTFLESLTRNFLDMLGELSQKHKPLGLLMAIRIWRNLVDRNKNEKLFKTPRIFFQDCDYKLVIRKCSRADKQFFKSLRQQMYELVLQGFLQAEFKWHLELLYQLIALTLVEIPCGYTASTNTAIIMHLQDYAFKISNTNLIKAHHLHAIVLSIMSLICYIHNASILYKYVNDIMDRRAEWAPHLSPPLLQNYEYAVHHVLWNKPNLFFQDWEAGYGLWKCFREKKKHKK